MSAKDEAVKNYLPVPPAPVTLTERLRDKATYVWAGFDTANLRALLNEAADAIEGALELHKPIRFQGNLYCVSCRAKYWPREGPHEAAWPCKFARTLGVE